MIRVVKELRPLVRAAIAAGWTVTKTGGGHLRFRSPTGALVFAPSTPSDHRSVKNTAAELRRHGLDLPR